MKINIDFIYPIGSIYETTSTIHPNVLFGGTWEEYGRGRVTVGLYPEWTETSQIGQIGGSKYIQAHTHTTRAIKDRTGTNCENPDGGCKANNKEGDNYGYTNWTTLTMGGVSGVETGNSGNMQPYIVVYRYRRIA